MDDPQYTTWEHPIELQGPIILFQQLIARYSRWGDRSDRMALCSLPKQRLDKNNLPYPFSIHTGTSCLEIGGGSGTGCWLYKTSRRLSTCDDNSEMTPSSSWTILRYNHRNYWVVLFKLHLFRMYTLYVVFLLDWEIIRYNQHPVRVSWMHIEGLANMPFRLHACIHLQAVITICRDVPERRVRLHHGQTAGWGCSILNETHKI